MINNTYIIILLLLRKKGRAKVRIEQLPEEDLKEMSMLEIAYELLLEKNQPMHLNDLVDEIAKLLGSTKEEIAANIAQFYTDLNVDGRFLNIGGNTWGYKGWYPVEQFEDDFVPTVRVKKKKAKVAELEDEDFEELEDEDLEYEDLDEFVDDFDEEEEEEEEELDEDLEALEEFDDDIVDDEEEEELLIDEEFEEDELDIEEDDEFIDEENEEDR